MTGGFVLDAQFAHAQRRALEMTGPMLAAYLKDKLGRPLVAHVTNVRFPNAVTHWARGRQPNRYALNRLHLLATLLFVLEECFEEPGAAARWLTLDHPGLAFRAPIDALAEGAFAEVFAVAREYATDPRQI